MTSLIKYMEDIRDVIYRTEITNINEGLIPSEEEIKPIIEVFQGLKHNNKTLFIIGNGGSAAIASHVQNDLCKGSGIKAMVFNETPLLTAFANDISYQAAFEHILRLWASPGDLLIAISSSGRSENILNAAKAARELGCTIITLSGFLPNNPLRQMGDINIYVPSGEYGVVETAHGTILHYLTDCVKT